VSSLRVLCPVCTGLPLHHPPRRPYQISPVCLSHHPSLWRHVMIIEKKINFKQMIINFPDKTTLTSLDPTIQQPGFNLPHCTWSLLNHWHVNIYLANLHVDVYPANLQRLILAKWAVCEYEQQQTINHIVNMCPLTKFEGKLQALHNVEDDAFNWLVTTVIRAFVKWKKKQNCWAYLECNKMVIFPINSPITYVNPFVHSLHC